MIASIIRRIIRFISIFFSSKTSKIKFFLDLFGLYNVGVGLQ